MKKNIKLFVLIAAGFISGSLLLWQWSATNLEIKENNVFWAKNKTAAIKQEKNKQKPPTQTVKGVYLTAYSAGNPEKIDEIIELLNKTELNAVVIDIKDYSGKILYDSHLPIVKNLNLKENRLPDLAKIIQKLHSNKIYVIARQTVFQDPILAEKKPQWSLKDKNGQLWRDKNGLAWVNAANKYIWNYNLAIAKEAAEFGFDEINFDYVRFPSDGQVENIKYSSNFKKFEIMKKFFHYLSQETKDEPFWISVDFFGLTMERRDDLGIGQRIVDALGQVDYICPMMYPSHYYSGHLNFENPAEHPAEVVKNGMLKGSPMFANQRAKLRPWLQAFDLGAEYDAEKIKAQINEVEKYTSAGWLLWNAANLYTNKGLK